MHCRRQMSAPCKRVSIPYTPKIRCVIDDYRRNARRRDFFASSSNTSSTATRRSRLKFFLRPVMGGLNPHQPPWIRHWINKGIERHSLHAAYSVRWVWGCGRNMHVTSSVATGLLKISPDLGAKNLKNPDKEKSSNLQIPPKLPPKCCIILH